MDIERIYIGRKIRFIVQQEIGFFKILSQLRERFEVKELKDNEETIILVETIETKDEKVLD